MHPRRLSDIALPIPPPSSGDTDYEREKKRKAAETVFREMESAGFPTFHLSAYRAGKISMDVQGKNQWARKLDMLVRHLHPSGALMALIGPRGTGKTQMATVAANIYSNLRYECGFTSAAKYVRTMEFFMAVKDAYGASTSERDAFAAFIRPSLLVLDEVQVRNGSDWESNALTYLIDSRYGSGRRTILISNQTAEGFTESMGDSIMSRLSETGAVISCQWESFRGAGNE